MKLRFLRYRYRFWITSELPRGHERATQSLLIADIDNVGYLSIIDLANFILSAGARYGIWTKTGAPRT